MPSLVTRATKRPASLAALASVTAQREFTIKPKIVYKMYCGKGITKISIKLNYGNNSGKPEFVLRLKEGKLA